MPINTINILQDFFPFVSPSLFTLLAYEYYQAAWGLEELVGRYYNSL